MGGHSDKCNSFTLCLSQSLPESLFHLLLRQTASLEPHSLPWHWNPCFPKPLQSRRRHVRQPEGPSHQLVPPQSHPTSPCSPSPGATSQPQTGAQESSASGGEGVGGSSAVTSTSPQKAEERRLRPPGGGVGGAFPSWWEAADRREFCPQRCPRGKRKRRIEWEDGRAPAAMAIPEGLEGSEDSPCLEGPGSGESPQ